MQSEVFESLGNLPFSTRINSKAGLEKGSEGPGSVPCGITAGQAGQAL